MVVALLCASTAQAASLPSVGSGHRPGPDVLYEKAPRAPQLENRGAWKAKPILVSGATAYRRGEFLYQDFLYDSHGAGVVRDPSDPFALDAFLFSPKAGTVTYPTGPAFANDAADLVELRVKPLADATAFRITLNTMIDADRTATTIALGDGESVAWPHGAGLRSPAQLFLTVHGASADLLRADGTAVSPAPAATVDTNRRQITVTVPHAAWNPRREIVRMAAGVGLWDPAAGAYQPTGLVRSATQPGGGGVGSAVLNLAFRGAEPVPDLASIPAGVTIGDAAAGAAVLGSWWREKRQSELLAQGDGAEFHADVDFGKLAARTTDNSAVPRTGPMDRILASARSFGQGVDYTQECGGLAGALAAYKPCTGPYIGQLQPYALFVPAKRPPLRGFGFTLLLHSLSANYNQYLGSKNQSQIGNRAQGSIVATPEGRGPDGSYRDVAEADAFEVWADVARRYKLDPGFTAVSGYSMGGFGTFRMLERWPDLFARGFAVVGAGDPDEELAGMRNTPVMMWNAVGDELVNINTSESTVAALTKAGLRFESFLFPVTDHLTLATNDEYGPGAAFLGDHRVNRNPPHITYVVDPSTDFARDNVRADHVYWLSGLAVREDGTTGTIDARSSGFGRGDAPTGAVMTAPGTLEGGSRGPAPYIDRTLAWGAAPRTPRQDLLTVAATGVGAATVDTRRARLSCGPHVDLTADGATTLRLACPAVRAPHCARPVRVRVPVAAGAATKVRTRGRVKGARRRFANGYTFTRKPGARVTVIATIRFGDGRQIVATQRVNPCR
ncbi:MAG: hypothetical protein QOF76_1144 [Solirubrobacteraceae bacterium]|nr:hypothetical protein [Solirubrobacteraceae bacterium]